MTRIIGIDPGSQRTGVGIIDVAADGRVSPVWHGPLVLLGADDFPQRLKTLVLGLPGKLQADAADALAVAITHAHVRATAQRLGVNTRQAWRK